MRDPNRIPDFMNNLGKIWRKNLPDWRFGQLMCNFICETGDPFYWEDKMFLEKFNNYVNKVTGKNQVEKEDKI